MSMLILSIRGDKKAPLNASRDGRTGVDVMTSNHKHTHTQTHSHIDTHRTHQRECNSIIVLLFHICYNIAITIFAILIFPSSRTKCHPFYCTPTQVEYVFIHLLVSLIFHLHHTMCATIHYT